jgi:hypothetical protein
MKVAVLWDMTSSSLYRLFRGSFSCCGLFRRLIAELSLQGPVFNPRILCGIVVEQVSLGERPLRLRRYSPDNTTLPALHTHFFMYHRRYIVVEINVCR